LPANPNQKRGSGETSAKSNPEGATVNRLLLVALTVIVVLWAALPDNVEGEKLQPHPLGRPEQANDREALNPFSGATETFNDPVVPDIARVALESASP
jgi:energy-converting hydrogenase Eha subunit F